MLHDMNMNFLLKHPKKNLENVSTTVCALDILGDSSIFFDTFFKRLVRYLLHNI